MDSPIYVQKQRSVPRTVSSRNRLLAQDLILGKSPGSFDIPKQVVIVMDGQKEPSLEVLQWVLEHFAKEGQCSVTILGVMAWPTFAFSGKTPSPIWMLDIEDIVTKQDKTEWKNYLKYLKVQPLIDLCRKYGVIPQVKPLMGFPTRLLVGEQITSLHATLLVIDRHHSKKNIEYYTQRIPCNIVAMNNQGEFDMIKARSGIDMDDYSVGGTPAPTPKLMINVENMVKNFKFKDLMGKLSKERYILKGS